MADDRRLLGLTDEPGEDSAVTVHYPNGVTEIWAYMSSWNGRWNNVGTPGQAFSWHALLTHVRALRADGPYLLTEGHFDAYRRGWRDGRRELRRDLESVVEDFATRDPEEIPDVV